MVFAIIAVGLFRNAASRPIKLPLTKWVQLGVLPRRGIRRVLPSMVYARGNVKIQCVLMTSRTKATATTATLGPRISKR